MTLSGGVEKRRVRADFEVLTGSLLHGEWTVLLPRRVNSSGFALGLASLVCF